MSAAPATNSRRIGDILLELGFATEADLAKATTEQEKTGQPLGQILVEHGAITRLELASALAEQWSDESASIKLLPIPPPASTPRRTPEPHHDDDQYAARLQDAVAELALRVGASAAQPTEEFDDRVTDLAERIEATVARTQRLEVTLATLAESFEGVTGGVEDAFNALQSGMAGLALDLGRIDTTVAELGTQTPDAPVVEPVLAAQLEELGAAVAALSERPLADPEVAGRLDALTERVHGLIETTETPDAALAARIDEISAAVEALAERPVTDPAAIETQLEALAARLERLGESDEVGELRSVVATIEERLAAVAERPVVDPAAIESRLDALAGQAEAAIAPAEIGGIRDSLIALEQRLARLAEDAGATAALNDQARSLTELRSALGELESRPAGNPELDERLARIETELADRLAAKPDAGEIDALAARLDVSADEHESLATAVAQLGVRVDEMTWRDDGAATRVEELHDRVESVSTTLTELHRALATHEDAAAGERLDELGRSLVAVREEVAALAQTLTPADLIDEIVDRVDDLAADREARVALAARLDEIEARLTAEVVTPDDLSRALAGARDDLTPAPAPLPDPRIDDLARELASLRDEQAPDPRVDLLADDITEVRARLAELGTASEPVADPAVHGQLEALAARIEQLAGDRESEAALAAKLNDLEQRFPTEVVTPDDLANALALARVGLTSSAPAAAAPDPRVDELAAELASLRDDRTTGDDPRVEQLAEDLLALRVELAEARSAPAPAVDDSAIRGELEELARRIEELTAVEAHDDAPLVAKVEELEQRLETPGATDPRVEQIASELEAMREQVAKVERTPVTDPGVASELDALSARLRFLDARVNEDVATSTEVTRAVDALRVELASAGAAGPAAEELQRIVDERVEAQITERLAELTHGLEDRLAAAETQPRVAGSGSGDTSGFEDLLERNRMTIERLGLHLGEHDRALAELMRSPNLPKKLDELAARVDETAGGAAPAGTPAAPGARREIGSYGASEPSTGEVKALSRRIEDAEIASQADREKLMNRLERMASSIDWRLQRLEAAETAAASTNTDD